MFSKIILNKQNLLDNLDYIKKQCGNKKICAMVKANAYGHGLKQVVSILSGKVNAFGVVNIEEALEVRKIDKQTEIIIFGICENIEKAIVNNIGLTVISVENLQEIIKTSKIIGKKPILHLNINSGMNRFGIKTQKQFNKVRRLLIENKIKLRGVFTHFASLTTDKIYSQKQKEMFDNFVSLLKKDYPIIHVGGGNSVFTQKGYQMYRVGLFLYGYGNENLKPVMSIGSNIVAIQNISAGEHVGYVSSFIASKEMQVGVVPVGYADGVKRNLSNQLLVKVNGKDCKNVGKICMDCFMIDITGLNAKVGDRVEIFWDAAQWMHMLNTTEYEILTNFNFFRGDRIIN